MYLGYEQVAADGNVQTLLDLAGLQTTGIASSLNATHCELQAETQNVRYTMDDTTDPSATSGMILIAGSDPTSFLIEDLRRIKFIQTAAGAILNIHYFGGRDV